MKDSTFFSKSSFAQQSIFQGVKCGADELNQRITSLSSSTSFKNFQCLNYYYCFFYPELHYRKCLVQWPEQHTNQNESGGLEEPFVVPVGVDLFQHVTHPIVFPQPDSSVHHQTGDQAKGLVAHSETMRIRNMRRVVHFCTNFLYSWRVYFTIQDLQLGKR